jgi:transposase
VRDGRFIQKTVLYLGEINDSQKSGWIRAIDVIEGRKRRQLALFPDTRSLAAGIEDSVCLRMSGLELRRPRQWGACWLAVQLWEKLSLDEFWTKRLGPSRKGTPWLRVFQTLVFYRLMDPGSEWRLHRYWYDHTALGDLLGEDAGLVEKDTLYRCHDKLLAHKDDLFRHLRGRWETLFGIRFEILLYDLTSTYFESEPPPGGKRRFGYSRDKRSDCVQVVIGLVVTPEGFPLAYEVFSGNTQDRQTLREILKKIETRYGKAERTWLMDRGIPTEEVLGEMRASGTGIQYLVGTPRGRLTRYEQEFSKRPWQDAREDVRVKLFAEDGEVYILAESRKRRLKERAMRLRKIRDFLKRLREIRDQRYLDRDGLLKKLGAAEKEAGRFAGMFEVKIPEAGETIRPDTFFWKIRKEKYRQTCRRDGQYLLRSNQTAADPAGLWKQYMVLVEIEEAFRNIKGDLSIRPVYHQRDHRVEAHIFISFMAYCLHVTLRQMAGFHAPGLTPRSVLEQMKTIQMIDVHIPTTDGRELKMSRYTRPERTQELILNQLNLKLPSQPPPEIRTIENGFVVKT